MVQVKNITQRLSGPVTVSDPEDVATVRCATSDRVWSWAPQMRRCGGPIEARAHTGRAWQVALAIGLDAGSPDPGGSSDSEAIGQLQFGAKLNEKHYSLRL